MPDVYEIVNATQLDSDLEDVADAIRAKSQGQDPLLFPSEFISEIGSIPTGASITGATDQSVKAIEAIAANATVEIFKGTVVGRLKILSTGLGGKSQRCRYNKTGTRLAVVGSGSYIKIYDSSTTAYSELSVISSYPPSTCYDCAWSADGTRLAIAHVSSPFITIYDTTTTPYTKIANPATLPAGNAHGCAWSPDGTRLAVSHETSPYITIYDTTTTPYTKIADPASLPPGIGHCCDWSPDGTRLAVGHASSPCITVYDTTATPYSALSALTSPGGTCYGIAWNPSGTRLAAAAGSSPYMGIYDTTTTPYTKLTNPSTLPGGSGNACCWSSDGTYLCIGHSKSTYISIYKTTSSPYTKVTGSSYTPNGASSTVSIYGIAMNDVFIAVASGGTTATASRPTIYVLGDRVAKASNVLNKDCKLGYAPSAVAKDATGTVKVLFT